MRKISDVIREKVDFINNTEHFRVDMNVIDSKVSDRLRIASETIELKLPENITMELSIAGQDNNGICSILGGNYPVFIDFKEDGINKGTIDILDYYNLRKDIKFTNSDSNWIYFRCEKIIEKIKEIPIYKS
ncbi:hypothetical protein [Clostridium perfringens]|uniref:hypothetical protein n=1 Tax=Clostridium perfringens TaxID=1502 RepID=UPI0018E43A63|nr:hypothetical protein [Clostridium perfringens]MBI6111758.1 hypothetical protein [Clostridium perfringens]MBI6114869.1 hypothetical protein [Clostridium perfringens]MDH5078441.1 hypothetical protein [Clostridium perfringens]